MPIKARFENGVFRPIGDVSADEGTIGDVFLPGEPAPSGKPNSVMDLGFFGLWEDRKDMSDGAEYVDRIRTYRRNPSENGEGM